MKKPMSFHIPQALQSSVSRHGNYDGHPAPKRKRASRAKGPCVMNPGTRRQKGVTILAQRYSPKRVISCHPHQTANFSKHGYPNCLLCVCLCPSNPVSSVACPSSRFLNRAAYCNSLYKLYNGHRRLPFISTSRFKQRLRSSCTQACTIHSCIAYPPQGFSSCTPAP